MRIIHLFIFLLLSFVFWVCNSPNQSVEESSFSLETEPAAIALNGRALYAPPESEASRRRKDSLLAIAAVGYQIFPDSLDVIIWYGRRLAYLSRYKEAIEVYTKGMIQFPDSPELYRHRGHRYISTRQFEKSIADFEKAARLVADRPIEIEPDGIPNKLNIPLSTLQFNIYYHWALAYYLLGNFEQAASIYEKCMAYSTNPDLLIATTDWLYMTYRRLGKDDKAAAVLESIHAEMEIVENHSYLSRLLFYKGEKQAGELLDLENEDPDAQLNIVTQGYGVANWHYYNGRTERAKSLLERLLETDYWSAFGYIAAEADLERLD